MKKGYIILLFLLLGCNIVKQQNSTSYSKTPIEIEVKDSGGTIDFKITNKSDSTLFIHNPQYIYIEKFSNNTWERLRILSCPCGAPCKEPKEAFEIKSNEYYVILWNKTESWCGKRNKEGIQKTLKEKVGNGRYRIRILYSLLNNKKKIIYKEFKLI